MATAKTKNATVLGLFANETLNYFLNNSDFTIVEGSVLKAYSDTGDITLLTAPVLEKMKAATDYPRTLEREYEKAVIAYNIRDRLDVDQMYTLHNSVASRSTVARWLECKALMREDALSRFETYFNFDPRVPNNVLIAAAKAAQKAKRKVPMKSGSAEAKYRTALAESSSPAKRTQLEIEEDAPMMKSKAVPAEIETPFTAAQLDRCVDLQNMHDDIEEAYAHMPAAVQAYIDVATSHTVSVMIELFPESFKITTAPSNGPNAAFEIACDYFTATICKYTVEVRQKKVGGSMGMSLATGDYVDSVSRVLSYFNTMSGDDYEGVLRDSGFANSVGIFAANESVSIDIHAQQHIDAFFTPSKARQCVERGREIFTQEQFLHDFALRLRGLQVHVDLGVDKAPSAAVQTHNMVIVTLAVAGWTFKGVRVSHPDAFPAVYVAPSNYVEDFNEACRENSLRSMLSDCGVRVLSDDDNVVTLVLSDQVLEDDAEDITDTQILLKFYTRQS